MWILTSLFLFSCHFESENKKHGRLYYLPNGRGSVEFNSLNDSLQLTEKKIFYQDGKIDFVETLHVHKTEGYSKEYFRNGVLASKIFFKNGFSQGRSCYWDTLGNLETVSHHLHGKLFGDSYDFYPDGKLESYRCLDYEEHTRYLVKYDVNGKIKKEEGLVLGQLMYYGDTIGISTGTNYTIEVCVSTPPGRKAKVQVIDSTIPNAKWIDLQVEDNYVWYERKFTTKGVHRIYFKGTLVDKAGKLIATDSKPINVTVK